jgi:channel protein (hemolysin III family)
MDEITTYAIPGFREPVCCFSHLLAAPVFAVLGFVLMGWGGLYAGVVFWRRYGSAFVRPLMWGGIAYTAAAVCLVAQWPTLIPGVVGPHEVWHVAVLVGLSLHWKFVWQFAAG